MALEIKYTIEEAPDARAIVFKDITGEYHETANPTGWGAPNFAHGDIEEARLVIGYQDGTSYEYELPLDGDFGALWEAGVEIKTQDIKSEPDDTSYPSLRFKDGVYDFQVFIVEDDTEYPEAEEPQWSVIMGFAAIITREVMRDSLTYHPSQEKQKKEWILEQMRLLDNLKYSADTGNLQFFQDNLTQLQKLR